MNINNIRKILVASVAVVAIALPLTACGRSGGSNGSSNSDRDNANNEYALEYEYDGYGAYTVTGFSDGYLAIVEEGDDVSTLEIPSSYMGKAVTAISDKAFNNCDFLYEVKIPDSVTYVGASAFSSCDQLRRLDMGNRVKYIAENAFDSCYSLSKVMYWGSVADWCSITFDNAYSNPISMGAEFYVDGAKASKISVPSSVENIRPYAFTGCTTINTVTFSDGLKMVGDYAFYGCKKLSTIELGGVVDIGDYAFVRTSVKSITLPETLESDGIGEKAFDECKLLYEVYDNGLGVACGSDELGGIGKYALDVKEKGELTGIVKNGEYTFYKSTSTGKTYLTGVPYSTTVTLPATEKSYVIAPYLFENMPIVSVKLSSSVSEIGEYAFSNCKKLVEITINHDLTRIGKGAFRGDTLLKAVNYYGTSMEYNSITFEKTNDEIEGETEPTSNPVTLGGNLYLLDYTEVKN